MRVLGRSSSINVRKVLWTCTEIGVDVEREDWGIGSRPTSDPAFLALNPNAQVPVLVDGEVVLWESNTICRYLAMRHRRFDLLPRQAEPRARVEMWMDWQATDLNAAWRYAFLALVRNSPDHCDTAAIRRSVDQWNRLMGLLDGQLAATGAYVAGEGFTLADVVLALSANRWLSTPMDRPALRHVGAWLDRMSTRVGFLAHATNGLP